jgi:hypothetical protein
MNPRIIDVQYQSPYRLILTFTNKEVKEFNYSNYLDFPVYETLRDEYFSKKVRVFNGTVIWDDDIDFDPDTLYIESNTLAVV